MSNPELRMMFNYLMAISPVNADKSTEKALLRQYLSDIAFRLDFENKIWQALKTESAQPAP